MAKKKTGRSKTIERRALLIEQNVEHPLYLFCLLYTSPSPRDATLSRMPSSA